MVAVLPRGAIIIIVVTKSDRWKISAGMTLHAEAREAIIQSERFDGQNAWRCREFCLKRNVIANAASPLNQEPTWSFAAATWIRPRFSLSIAKIR